MASRVIVVPGGAEFSQNAVPRQMVEDLRNVAEIPADNVLAVADALEAEEGFLSPTRLNEILKAKLANDRFVNSASAALQNLRSGSVEQTIRSLREWRDTVPDNARLLPDNMLHSLDQNLRILIRPYPAMARQRKASRLASITGNVAETVALICDARPVFNESRDAIEGMVPLVTLRIAYERQDEDTEVFEVHLTPEMVVRLSEGLKTAQRKLKVLSHSIETWVPNGLAASSE
jgi:hypothetical protein